MKGNFVARRWSLGSRTIDEYRIQKVKKSYQPSGISVQRIEYRFEIAASASGLLAMTEGA